jgi:gliding motility-associated-like protein
LIPNAISPNDDGKNDVWKLDFLNILYPNAYVEIFNEWGQSIFTSEGYNVPWNGTIDGEPVPDGTYYYILDLNSISGDDASDIYKGTILVLTTRD